MRETEGLKKYLRNSFIDDVLSKIDRPNIEMTSEYVWGKYIKLPFYHDGMYDTDTFELENWYITFDISEFNTTEELTSAVAKKITREETSRLYAVDKGEYKDTIVCHQLVDWRILTDEDGNPLRGNMLTLVKYAKFIDMAEYGFKHSVEEIVFTNDKGGIVDGGIIASDPIVDPLSFSNPTIEEAYKQGIRDALDWLTEPTNQDTYSDEYGERIYYFVYEDEIDQFAREKGIRCKTKSE